MVLEFYTDDIRRRYEGKTDAVVSTTQVSKNKIPYTHATQEANIRPTKQENDSSATLINPPTQHISLNTEGQYEAPIPRLSYHPLLHATGQGGR